MTESNAIDYVKICWLQENSLFNAIYEEDKLIAANLASKFGTM